MSKVRTHKPPPPGELQTQKDRPRDATGVGQRVVLPPPVLGRFTLQQIDALWFAVWNSQRSGQE